MVLETLKKLRTDSKLTYADVAKQVDLTTTGYWQIENGKRSGSYQTMVKIAKVFDTTPDKIFLPTELTKS